MLFWQIPSDTFLVKIDLIQPSLTNMIYKNQEFLPVGVQCGNLKSHLKSLKREADGDEDA